MIMKNVLAIPAALLVAASALSSCSKSKYENTDQLAALGKATITGKAYAQLDATNTTMEMVPAGTVIKAWINSKDLVVGDTTGLQFYKKYYETTVGASGKFSLTVDVSKYDSVWVTLDPQDFTASYKASASSTQTKTYKSGESVIKVGINETDTATVINYAF